MTIWCMLQSHFHSLHIFGHCPKSTAFLRSPAFTSVPLDTYGAIALLLTQGLRSPSATLKES